MTKIYDIAIIGGGIAGFTSALRLQNAGFNTLLLEAHGQVGGCAGFYTKKGFTFDVGATTLVDFGQNGVGGRFLHDLEISLPKHKVLDYKFWLPDRVVTLFNDRNKWSEERLIKFGSSENHKNFWKLIDKITDAFWTASRKGIKLPIQSFRDIVTNINSLGILNIHLLKYLNASTLDVLKKFKLDNDKPLIKFLSALIEDTIHSNIKDAPFINAALGTTIRGAGIMRLDGGMKSLWKSLENKYDLIGGVIKKGNKVSNVEYDDNLWSIKTNKSNFLANKVISSLPIKNTLDITPKFIHNRISQYYDPLNFEEGGAVVIFLGIPESDVQNESITHHQIVESYDQPLGLGNNMFISVSSKDDLLSAPSGYRAVMISTHCDLSSWKNLNEKEYQTKKKIITDKLINNARKVYPELAKDPVLFQVGTPRSYQTYTHRKNGAVGGFKQTTTNANLKSIPQNIGLKNFYLVGDNTWPGLGTVAGIISSRNVFNEIRKPNNK